MDAWWQIAWRFIGFGLVAAVPGVLIGFRVEKTKRGPNRWWCSLLVCMIASAQLEFYWRIGWWSHRPTPVEYIWWLLFASILASVVLNAHALRPNVDKK